MATKGPSKKKGQADPMRTRNGKERLGPLNIAQLEKMLGGARKKTVAKIARRIAELKSRPSYRAPVVQQVPAETPAE
jgi:hypothetical protein